MTDWRTDWPYLPLVEKIDIIKSCVSPLDIADLNELGIEHGKIRSPFNPDERTPSCHLYEDHWYDFSTGKGGDVIDLLQAYGDSRPRAIERLSRLILDEDWDPDRVDRPAPAEPPDLTELFYSLPAATSGHWREWAERIPPIGPHLLEFFEVHHAIGRAEDGSLWVPHWHDGKVRGIKVRSLSGAKSAVPGSTFACGLYRIFRRLDSMTLVLTEGESDCWSLYDVAVLGLDVDVMALPSGAGTWKDRWLEPLDQYELIYTAFDNDRAGQQATERVRKAIGWERWRELKVPSLFNDVREAMAAGWEPALKEIA